MNESEFWSKRVRPLLAPQMFVKRIENGLDAGTPDVFYCCRGESGWIENKYRAAVPRMSTVVFPPSADKGDDRTCKGLRKAQVTWWFEYHRAHGAGAIVAGVGEHTFWFDPFGWLSPSTKEGRVPIYSVFNTLNWGQFQYYGRDVAGLVDHLANPSPF